MQDKLDNQIQEGLKRDFEADAAAVTAASSYLLAEARADVEDRRRDFVSRVNKAGPDYQEAFVQRAKELGKVPELIRRDPGDPNSEVVAIDFASSTNSEIQTQASNSKWPKTAEVHYWTSEILRHLRQEVEAELSPEEKQQLEQERRRYFSADRETNGKLRQIAREQVLATLRPEELKQLGQEELSRHRHDLRQELISRGDYYRSGGDYRARDYDSNRYNEGPGSYSEWNARHGFHTRDRASCGDYSDLRADVRRSKSANQSVTQKVARLILERLESTP